MGMLPIPKEIRDEAKVELIDLARRYITIYPDELLSFDTKEYIGFTCLVKDEESGITRTLLEKLGYVLEETGFIDMFLITLRTRFEKPKKR
jgi:hypothetical protein